MNRKLVSVSTPIETLRRDEDRRAQADGDDQRQDDERQRRIAVTQGDLPLLIARPPQLSSAMAALTIVSAAGLAAREALDDACLRA